MNASTQTSESSSAVELVTLISAEGERLVLEKAHAERSGTLKDMLSGPRGGDTTLHLPAIRKEILEIVCRYLEYSYIHRDNEDAEDFDFPSEHAQEVLLAAHFLDC
uniref:Elongin-C n=1 Tax=Steinernema glaseri TaxID=37863 RepID=A0A1I7Z7X1_9BILA